VLIFHTSTIDHSFDPEEEQTEQRQAASCLQVNRPRVESALPISASADTLIHSPLLCHRPERRTPHRHRTVLTPTPADSESIEDSLQRVKPIAG
jgi:hypothetical protein